ncbi:histidinol dehydrogenase [Sphingomonas aerophila]|uniref:Histidinol dehydrogenase n=1 Tax=Sphingomonas aerophila TaxID=1344948 RepID=A0A7W9BD26_9SPHN|nr:histidinol dehydrogenase [Sphingomonas aerophila]MBB5715029.1 histidinol dehydrogenase [Sphingomonas aerophila]
MIRLDATSADFADRFADLVDARRESATDVAQGVATIIGRVRTEGEEALIELTRRLDRFDPVETGWAIDPADCEAAYNALEPGLRTALDLAASRIRAYHERQRPTDTDYRDEAGVRLGARWRPVDAAGLYVPGGRAAYPSSLLMNAIPARVAGVERLAMVTPTPDGQVNHLVLAAAHVAGITEIWRVGGAQAIAALAHGAGPIAPVDVVTGPGNAWVAEAKRQLYGVVGIDMVAGPSEIVVVADARNDPQWIAADLLSQAEHDTVTQSILFTDDAGFADAVTSAVEEQLGTLATGAVARTAWDANGAVIVVPSLAQAMPLVDRLAPEHLQLAVDEPQDLFDQVRHAGSVFLGRHTPEAIGDYVAGPNHVLPTGRRARFASGLSVLDFMKRTSFLGLDETALAELGPATVALAEAEGLPAHARSVALRLRLNR